MAISTVPTRPGGGAQCKACTIGYTRSSLPINADLERMGNRGRRTSPVSNMSEIMRNHASECFADYLQMVGRGEVARLQDGSIANFPTMYVASRLVNDGHADTFANTRHIDIPWFAEHLREYVEDEIISGVGLPQGQFALDLAFLMLDQVDWQVVAELLSELIIEQHIAMRRLQGKPVPELESRPMSPEEWAKLTGQG